MEPLSVELEAACLRALNAAWETINWSRFSGKMKPPALELGDATSRLGRWEPHTRTIQIARSLVLERGWGQVIEVLKHEMVHQYVWEVLGEHDETAHGPLFQDWCTRLGVDATASGLPSVDGDVRHRLVDRVTKLLALAASPNEHEAQAAMAAAQRLMLKHNIEAVGQPGTRRYGYRHLGKPTGRIPEAQRILAGILAQHFFVECIWIPVWRPLEGKRGTVLEICGSPENLELAAHVHEFLTATAARLWDEFRKRHRWSAKERGSYEAGVMTGFRSTLLLQQKRNKEEALVWKGDADLGGYYKRRWPHTRSARYTSTDYKPANILGREAGSKIILHKPVSTTGGGGPKLLGGR